ncbi:hypothetical protein D1224_09600 [Henriciella barbarensis]|uniref:Uncharacterized protein n=1 Tax=Henriciella barbarensis TaxID=86342 RepID=A0A399R3N0_9PROT|nr:hypothetical protein [Henriciella barbarensis]RIJ24467.1 hypothetical protein D1224_09600 [Henriciella barbarensis]
MTPNKQKTTPGFRIRSQFVSASGLPSGLTTRSAVEHYIMDVTSELRSLRVSWRSYSQQSQPTSADNLRFLTHESKLEILRDQALAILKEFGSD